MTLTETFKWQNAAACRYGPLDLFFGPEGEQQHEKPPREAAAKKICARCSVRAACLDDAVTNGVRFGVFGGTGEDERRAMRDNLRRRMRAAEVRASGATTSTTPATCTVSRSSITGTTTLRTTSGAPASVKSTRSRFTSPGAATSPKSSPTCRTSYGRRTSASPPWSGQRLRRGKRSTRRMSPRPSSPNPAMTATGAVAIARTARPMSRS
jgi:WhiB family transcriptional regulator, redox-sensing transcriptional regulator